MTRTKKDNNMLPLVDKVRTVLARFDSVRLFYVSVLVLLCSFLTLIYAARLQSSRARPVVPQKGYALNTVISMGLASVEIKKVSFSGGQPGFQPPESKQYVVVELSVKNNVDRPIDVMPSSDTYLKTGDGTVSYLSPFGLANPFHAGKLLPGETVTGELSYLASKSDKLKLYVDGIWSGGVIPFEIR